MRADAQEQITVSVLVALEVAAEVEQRLRQDLALSELKRDQQAAQPPIAIHERVNGFELVVNQGEVNQDRELTIIVANVSFQVVERRSHLHHWRGNKTGSFGGCARSTDDDRLTPELTWAPVFPPDTTHERFVDVADQSQADRHAVEEREPQVERADVVCDFMDVGLSVVRGGISLEQHELLEAGCCAFDAARKDGFLTKKGSNQELGIGQHATDSPEFPKNPLSFGEQIDGAKIEGQGSGQRVGGKGEMPPRVSDEFPRGIIREQLRIHGVSNRERMGIMEAR